MGSMWTEQEINKLKNLIDDNQGKKQNTIADIAIKYDMFPKRTKGALTTMICKLLKPEPQDDEVDIFEAIQNAQYEELERKYLDLIRTILGTATNFPSGKGMKLDYNAIMRWMYKNEPDRTAKRAAELDEEREADDKKKGRK